MKTNWKKWRLTEKKLETNWKTLTKWWPTEIKLRLTEKK